MTDAQLLLEVQEIKDNTKKLLLLVGGDLATGAKGVIQRLDDHEKDDDNKHGKYDLKHETYDAEISKRKGANWAFGIVMTILGISVSILAVLYSKGDKAQASTTNTSPAIYVTQDKLNAFEKFLKDNK